MQRLWCVPPVRLEQTKPPFRGSSRTQSQASSCGGRANNLTRQLIEPLVIRPPAEPIEFGRHPLKAVAGKLQRDPLDGFP